MLRKVYLVLADRYHRGNPAPRLASVKRITICMKNELGYVIRFARPISDGRRGRGYLTFPKTSDARQCAALLYRA